MIRTAFLALALIVAGYSTAAAQSAPAPAPTPTPNNEWRYAVTPYIWLPNINGNLNFQRNTILPNPPPNVPPTVNVGVQAGPNNYLANLNFGFLVAFEARKNDFSIFGDYINANLSTNSGGVRTITGPGGKLEIPVTTATSTHVFSGIFTIGAGYTVAKGEFGNLDFGLGMRNINMRASADYALSGPITEIPVSGSLDGSATLTDAIFAMRGRLNLGERWYVPYYADIGTGNSNTTWQYLLAIAYAGRTNDVIFGYRNLGYNQNNGQLIQNVRFGGPMLGLRIHW